MIKPPFEIPSDVRIKSLCNKCVNLESCFKEERSAVLEDSYEPCDDICGECSLCCNRFESRLQHKPEPLLSDYEDILSDGDLPF